MHNYSLFMHSPFFGAGISTFVILAAIWSLAWKGWALWLAARRGEKVWFIVLLVLNTLGILEIIYIFAVAKQKFPLNSGNGAAHDHHHTHEHSHEGHSHEDHDHAHH